MQSITGSFQTRDGLTIHTVRWLPENAPKAIVILLHGIAEHSGRYQHVAEFLTEHGYAVFSLDHRGHGRSEGTRAHFDSLDQPLSDLEQYFEQVKSAHPDAKIFMYGHSMGAVLSLMFVLEHQDKLAGWIASGISIMTYKNFPAWMATVADLLRRTVPRLPFRPIDASLLSRDPETVAAYKTDPLVYSGPIRVGIGFEVVMGAWSLRERVAEIHLPFLLLHGSEDMLAPVSGSHYVYNNAASKDKSLKVYEGLYHEVHNEPEKVLVFNDMLTWLESH